MFKTIKAKLQERNLRKEKDYLEHKRTETLKYENSLQDLTMNYEPLHTKYVQFIHRNDLGRYPLKDILEVKALDNNKFEFKIYDVKEDYWDGNKCLVKGNILLKDTIQLNSLEDCGIEPLRKYVINLLMPKLRDLSILTFNVTQHRKELEELENKIKDLEKQI